MTADSPAQWSLRSPLRSVKGATRCTTAPAPLGAGGAGKHIKVPSSPGISHRPGRRLMTELSLAGEHHCHPALIGGGDDLGVAHRSPGLHDRSDARGGCLIHSVAEWEEGVGAE